MAGVVAGAEWLALLEMLDTCPDGRPQIMGAPEVNEPPPPPPPPHPGDVVNCSDFDTYDEAYAWFNQYYDDFGDIANLDRDGDGIPCASLPGAPSSRSRRKGAPTGEHRSERLGVCKLNDSERRSETTDLGLTSFRSDVPLCDLTTSI